ncbi:DUF2225 domain-containing protein [Alkalicoccus urumqiensis]|nr:DUF2225 domain-containing protein [Alkalicoccus urumqiensis]
MSDAVTPFYPVQISCGMCQSSYKTMQIRSRFLRVKEVHADFSRTFKDPSIDPLLYEVSVCSKCGYASTATFLPVRKADVIERFAEEAASKWEPRDFGGERTEIQAVHCWKLALYCASFSEQPHAVTAGAALKLHWMLQRTAEGETENGRFLRLAASEYEASYMSGDFQDTDMDELTLLFLLGETNRQLEEAQKAGTYFSKIFQHKEKDLHPALVERAREQWQETRTTSKA